MTILSSYPIKIHRDIPDLVAKDESAFNKVFHVSELFF